MDMGKVIEEKVYEPLEEPVPQRERKPEREREPEPVHEKE